MPMRAKGPRLYFRRRAGRPGVWVIKDTGGIEIGTGTADRGEAESHLESYLTQKRRSDSGPARAADLTVAEALSIYGTEHAPHTADPARIGYAIEALLPFWGNLSVAEVKGATCRRYVATRKAGPGTIRRELGALQAALRYCHREGYLTEAPAVTLPPKPETRQKALTRDEAARLLRAARALDVPHIARFILVALYTGTRKDAILNLRLSGPSAIGGWFDLSAGLLYRRGADERETRKRRPPVRLPRQLLAHARRWQASGATWAVEWRGQRVGSIKTAWRRVSTEAKLDWVTPHTLKHTAITWAIAQGASVSDAAGFFGTSVETIERVYWHHSPDFQAGAVAALERNRGRSGGAG